MRVLVTGAAGFIGMHASRALLAQGCEVLGVDSLSDYYPVEHKLERLALLSEWARFSFAQVDITDAAELTKCWHRFEPQRVLHLAAQAGVRYSLERPEAYIQANVVGFQNVIERVRHARPESFVYASSSSVYGASRALPFRETQETASPVSLYAATKLANELVAKAYSHLFGIPAVGLRFFTVYGPHYRPDMAIYRFATQILDGLPIPVFNGGAMTRDFTYVDDAVDGILRALARPEPAQIYNIGKGAPDTLPEMIAALERHLGRPAVTTPEPMQAGDVLATHADVTHARDRLGYEPRTSLDAGIQRFCAWFLAHRQPRAATPRAS